MELVKDKVRYAAAAENMGALMELTALLNEAVMTGILSLVDDSGNYYVPSKTVTLTFDRGCEVRLMVPLPVVEALPPLPASIPEADKALSTVRQEEVNDD